MDSNHSPIRQYLLESVRQADRDLDRVALSAGLKDGCLAGTLTGLVILILVPVCFWMLGYAADPVSFILPSFVNGLLVLILISRILTSRYEALAGKIAGCYEQHVRSLLTDGELMFMVLTKPPQDLLRQPSGIPLPQLTGVSRMQVTTRATPMAQKLDLLFHSYIEICNKLNLEPFPSTRFTVNPGRLFTYRRRLVVIALRRAVSNLILDSEYDLPEATSNSKDYNP